MTDIVIRGTLTTAALTHQTSPSGKGEQIKTDVLGPDGLIRGVPYITANSVRGLIRREAGHLVMERLQESQSKIHRNLYLSIMRGSYARTGIDAGGATYIQQLMASKHVFGGLFGGGGRMYRSPFRLERDLLPVLESYRGLFPFEQQSKAANVEHWKLLTKAVLAPRDDLER
jgi:CRISPR type IV-associated protein Csf2